MIQKRYEWLSNEGKKWTDWADFIADDSKLDYLRKEEKWQLKGVLKNEYRIVPDDTSHSFMAASTREMSDEEIKDWIEAENDY